MLHNRNYHKINKVRQLLWANHFVDRKNPEVKNRKNPLVWYFVKSNLVGLFEMEGETIL